MAINLVEAVEINWYNIPSQRSPRLCNTTEIENEQMSITGSGCTTSLHVRLYCDTLQVTCKYTFPVHSIDVARADIRCVLEIHHPQSLPITPDGEIGCPNLLLRPKSTVCTAGRCMGQPWVD